MNNVHMIRDIHQITKKWQVTDEMIYFVQLTENNKHSLSAESKHY